jgi:hypothetical protein
MTLETIARTIQLVLAPVVMVTACAILVGGLLSRYAAINDRLRLLARERLDLLNTLHSPLAGERLSQIDAQIPILLRHHKLAHDSILAVYLASAVFIGDMFIIALGAAMYADWIGAVVLIVFLIGVALLLYGLLLTALEVRTSHRALHYEIERIMRLRPPDK